MLDDTTKHDRILRAAMKLAESRGWRSLGLADIADEADISLSALHSRFRTRAAILEAFIEAADSEVLKKTKKQDRKAPARDRLFEVVMTRFDVLKPYRGALRRIRGEARCSLPDAGTARLLCASVNSQKWMLTAAGIPVSGGRGCARVSGLACIYARVVPVWLRDEDPDLSRTMAALDRELQKGERWLKRLDAVVHDLCRFACRFAPRRGGDAGGSADAGPAPQPPTAPEPGAGPMAGQPGAG